MTQPLSFRNIVLASIAFLAWGAVPLLAEPNTDAEADDSRDPRVREMLSSANLRFGTDKDGDYLVRFRTSDGEQTVFVLSGTTRLLDLEMRDAFAVSFEGSGPVSGKLINELLLFNGNADPMAGAWEIQVSDDEPDEWTVAFRVKLPARMTPASFKAMLRHVAKTAADFRRSHEEKASP